MSVVSKVFAFVMLPLAILIMLEALKFFTWNTPVDKVLVGAILMIVLQVINLVMSKVENGTVTMMALVTGGIFILVALLYIVGKFMSLSLNDYVPMILAVIMFVEAMYALH